jgi:hypothetical protein
MFKEVAMAYFKILFQQLPETAKENHKKSGLYLGFE